MNFQSIFVVLLTPTFFRVYAHRVLRILQDTIVQRMILSIKSILTIVLTIFMILCVVGIIIMAVLKQRRIEKNKQLAIVKAGEIKNIADNLMKDQNTMITDEVTKILNDRKVLTVEDTKETLSNIKHYVDGKFAAIDKTVDNVEKRTRNNNTHIEQLRQNIENVNSTVRKVTNDNSKSYKELETIKTQLKTISTSKKQSVTTDTKTNVELPQQLVPSTVETITQSEPSTKVSSDQRANDKVVSTVEKEDDEDAKDNEDMGDFGDDDSHLDVLTPISEHPTPEQVNIESQRQQGIPNNIHVMNAVDMMNMLLNNFMNPMQFGMMFHPQNSADEQNSDIENAQNSPRIEEIQEEVA